MLEDMVKKIIMDMVKDDVVEALSDDDSSFLGEQNKPTPCGSSKSTRSSKSSSTATKKSLSELSLDDFNFDPLAGKKKKDKRDSKKKSKRRMQKHLSIMSLVKELSQEFDFSFTDINYDDDPAAAPVLPEEQQASSTARKSKCGEGKKKKDKKEKKKKESSNSSSDKRKKTRKSKTGRKSRGESITSRSSGTSLRSSTSSMRNNSNKKTNNSAALKLQIEEVMNDLINLRSQQRNSNSDVPTELLDHDDDCSDSGSVSTLGTMGSTRSMSSTRSKPGSRLFNQEMASKLHSHRKSLCIQGNDYHKYPQDDSDNNPSSGKVDNNNNIVVDDDDVVKSEVDDFVAAFDPNDMRCLALVSHNEMKATMKEFVIKYKNVLKKFRLTGTNSTMTMLGQVFKGDDTVVFGPACSSGPLGGDAELVAMMAQGKLGGILFFQDPMTSHPHQCDIECLVRQALVHNTVIATTPTTAMTIMEVLKMALMGNGRPELLPSFFFSLQSPTVESYKKAQAKVILDNEAVDALSRRDL